MLLKNRFLLLLCVVLLTVTAVNFSAAQTQLIKSLKIDNRNSAMPALWLKAPFSGNATDSLLTWNPADSTVRKMAVSTIVTPPFTGGSCADAPIAAAGGTSTCAVYDSTCTAAGSYTFTFVTGGDFAHITVLDAGSGQFSITVDPNATAANRQAIVMVTSPCGTTTLLVYTQQGDASLCSGAAAVPAIEQVGGSSSLCNNGAAYLYLSGYPATGNFTWTLNGQVVGRGNNYTATTSGKYTVYYANAIGCTGSSFQVSLGSGDAAPDPVRILAVGNNSMACGTGKSVQIIVTTPSSGTVIWFKNGVLQNGVTGATIDATAGVWTAAVQDGSCYSTPSQPVTVTENTAPAAAAAPQMKINGTLVTGPLTLCNSASLNLQVNAPVAGIAYTWYINNMQVGTGTAVYYPMAGLSAGQQLVVGLMASAPGSCSVETLVQNAIGTSVAPAAPAITVNTPGNTLCAGQAVLTASGIPADSYVWFFNDNIIDTATSQVLNITQAGSYAVAAVTGGCQSARSGATSIAASDFATASWQSKTDVVNTGDNKSYSVSLDNPSGAIYNWTVGNNGVITNGQGTSSINVNFTAAGTESISCAVTNSCGSILNAGGEIATDVTVNNACTPAAIVSGSTANNYTFTAGSGAASMSIAAIGTSVTYQWYSGAIGSGTAISGATSASYNFSSSTTGTYTFYCVAVSSAAACAASPATSGLFTVTVQPNPAALPAGTGSFTGQTCFDIAKSNDNAGCGSLANRVSQMTDFTLRSVNTSTAPYTGVQVYTFIPSGTVSKLRFLFVDPTGTVVDSIVPGSASYATGANISTASTVTVYYKPSLQTTLLGLTKANALTVTLYAVYNNSANGLGTDMAVPLTATLADCACCGAATAANGGGWLNFMCYNLGADQTLSPYTPAQGLHGAFYQWGFAKPAVSAADNISNPNAVSGWSKSPVGTTDGNGDWNMATANPCPTGWVVPTSAQWTDVVNNNTWVILGTFSKGNNNWTSGMMVGNSLFLPATGYRISSDGSLTNRGANGYYWSSTHNNGLNAYSLLLGSGSVEQTIGAVPRQYGFSVRCVTAN